MNEQKLYSDLRFLVLQSVMNYFAKQIENLSKEITTAQEFGLDQKVNTLKAEIRGLRILESKLKSRLPQALLETIQDC